MKKCSYCGKEFPDTATVCDIDGRPLLDPNAPVPSSQTPRPSREYQRLPGRLLRTLAHRHFHRMFFAAVHRIVQRHFPQSEVVLSLDR